MKRALDLADEVAGSLTRRPPVGAVVVADDGLTVLGEGSTQPNAGPHAERVALDRAGAQAQGGTIYTTLEPHHFHSPTPPCTNAIINAGIARVVCPLEDPNPKVNGRGFAHLRAAGVEVEQDTELDHMMRARASVEGFTKLITTGVPLVTVKWAMSLDGKIATGNGDSKWITGSAARAHAHRLRYASDAVITGIGTLIADDPRLTARDIKSGERMRSRPRTRVVVDSQGRMSSDAALLRESGEVIHAVAEAGVGVEGVSATWQLPLDDASDRVDLQALIRRLGVRGYSNVLVEAGARLTAAMLELGLVDKVVAYISTSKIIGGEDAPSPIAGRGAESMSRVRRLTDIRVETLGEDIAAIGYLRQ